MIHAQRCDIVSEPTKSRRSNLKPQLTNNRDIRLQALLLDYQATEKDDGTKADRLYQAFLKTIEDGYWRPEDRLPSERQMAALLPVSEGTVQALMRRLVDNGIVHRKRGSGTYISNIDEGDNMFIRYLFDESPSTGKLEILNIEIDAVNITEIINPGPWSQFLGQRPSYIRMARHITVDSTFKVFGEFFFDGGRFRPLLDINPDTFHVTHVRKIIHDRFNAPILKIVQNLQFLPAESDVAAAIGIQMGDTIMLMEILNFSLNDEPIAYQRFYFPLSDRKLNIWSN